MSYILDALRRADSERERGAVPSIHSPPVPPVVDDPKPPRGARQSQVLVGVIVVLLLALAGLLAWHLMSGKPPAAVVAVVEPTPIAGQPVPPTTPAVQVAPAPAAAPVDPVPQVTAPVAQVTAAPTPAAPPPSMQAAPAQRPSPPTQAQAPMAAAPILSVPPRPATASNTTATTPPPALTTDADTRIHALGELPANIQRELPKLVIGGAMYSETPANRMLIINSQVFHEGDKLTPDLVLQEIRLKSAVLKYKGYRYGVSY